MLIGDVSMLLRYACAFRYVAALLTGRVQGRPQNGTWTLGRAQNTYNKGDGRFLAQLKLPVDGIERAAVNISSPPEFRILVYDNTSNSRFQAAQPAAQFALNEN